MTLLVRAMGRPDPGKSLRLGLYHRAEVVSPQSALLLEAR